jgi:hypothetical protein
MDPFIILCAEPALLQLLDSDNFGPFDPKQPDISLMQMLPLARSGLMYRGAYQILISLYMKANRLQFSAGVIYPDHLMNICFGGSIPARYYYYQNCKIHMDDAVTIGLFEQPLNTFDVIQRGFPDLNRTMIPIKIIKDIIDLNTTRYITDDVNLINSLDQEHDIILKVYAKWEDVMNYGTKEQIRALQEYNFTMDIKEPCNY